MNMETNYMINKRPQVFLMTRTESTAGWLAGPCLYYLRYSLEFSWMWEMFSLEWICISASFWKETAFNELFTIPLTPLCILKEVIARTQC